MLACASECGGWRWIFNIFLYYSLSYSLKQGVSEPGVCFGYTGPVDLPVTFLSLCVCIIGMCQHHRCVPTSYMCAGVIGVCCHAWLLRWVLGIQAQALMLLKQALYLLSHPPSL